MSNTEKKGQGVTQKFGEDGKTKKRTSKKDNKDSDDHCKDCRKIIYSETKALNCNFCFKWVCTECLEVPDDLYTVLVQNPKSLLLVPCKDCSSQISSLQEMRDTLNEVKANQAETKEQLDNLSRVSKINQDGTKKQLDNLNKKMLNLSKDLQKSVKETVKSEVDSQLGAKFLQVEAELNDQMDRRFEEIKKGKQAISGVTGDGAVSQDEIRDIVREAYKEEKMKDSKKPNLVIFNVPEKKTKDWQERKRNNMELVLKVLNFLLDMDNIESKIVKVVRMGKWEDEKIRPIKVVLTDPDTKYKFLQKSYKLSEADDEILKRVRISPDRTPSEIQRYKELRKELERRTGNGEKDLVIRRGKIVVKGSTITEESGMFTVHVTAADERRSMEETVEETHSQESDTDSVKEVDFSFAHGPEEQRYEGLFQVPALDSNKQRRVHIRTGLAQSGTVGDPGTDQYV